MSLRDWILEQLAMYLAYHRDARNQATHHIGVPVIVFSVLLALDQIVLPVAASTHFSIAQILLGVLILTYLIAAPAVGIAAAVFYAVVYAIVLRIPAPLVWPVAGGAFVLGWIVQFIGHAFEGRRPAFFVNILQVFMAPAFLIAEILFAVGFQKTLAHDLKARSLKYVGV
jgi:uncharacterized membrane protein YGL010W